MDAADVNTPLEDIVADLNAARPITAGGTGATNATAALSNLGITVSVTEIGYLSGVTSAIQSQMNAKAPLADPTFTGTATAPKLRLTDNGDASLSSTGHQFQIGPTSGLNLAMDGNEIMARNNGSATNLALNADGGNISMGDSSTTVTVSGNVTVSQAATFDGDVDFGQAWQDVSGSRVQNTTYTNSTGKPIDVCISVSKLGGSSGTTPNPRQFFVKTATGSFVKVTEVVDYSAPYAFTVTVPNGHSYYFTSPFDHWAELR